MPSRPKSLRRTCICFFSSRRRHTRLQGDWSSDVCSSDLTVDVTASDIPSTSQTSATSPGGGGAGGGAAFAGGSTDPKAIIQAAGCLACHKLDRSEERRVGKECRSRWSPYH